MINLIRYLSHVPNTRATVITGGEQTTFVIKKVVSFLKRIKAPLEYDIFEGIPDCTQFNEILDSVKKNRLAIKGSWATSLENNRESLNHAFRRDLDLWANVVHVKSFPFFNKRDDMDFVIIRQNTEGEYSQIEHETAPGFVVMFKVITESRSRDIAKFAFDYAARNNRKKIAAIHKANIIKMGDGLFLSVCREISLQHPNIDFKDIIVDNAAMQLVMRPMQFDIMLCPNLYGNIMVSIASGLIGSSALIAGANYNPQNGLAVFESAARGVDECPHNLEQTNPCSILLATSKLLKHINERQLSEKLETTIRRVIEKKLCLTPDIGGLASTDEFIEAVEKEFRKYSQT